MWSADLETQMLDTQMFNDQSVEANFVASMCGSLPPGASNDPSHDIIDRLSLGWTGDSDEVEAALQARRVAESADDTVLEDMLSRTLEEALLG